MIQVEQSISEAPSFYFFTKLCSHKRKSKLIQQKVSSKLNGSLLILLLSIFKDYLALIECCHDKNIFSEIQPGNNNDENDD